ncbi:dephospho-CoA kinase [Clostridium amylolyticum]|uniref:Dephospho-CoA kinase n=1 Tax=Clostridium amylolyticum TaxID=1121298 RepID=A0A1M6MMI5_9CLOT|nr:dephospho-CoA kinase [Clostridium amylolyticum]SHJ84672.1 dephospho-CoA kinase [Clostridium amylolyticum]
MLKIGLTGGIGSGKSTVSAMFKGAGFPIIDADVISRTVLDKYPEILQWIRKEFGDGFFDWQGNFLRRQFGNYIFKYQKERIKYEEKIMPYIKQDIFNEIKKYNDANTALVIIDAPTLIENNIHDEMDYVILVWVDKSTQIQRVKNRDKLVHSEIMSRINSQISLEEKKLYADFIIDNGGNLESTRQQVNDIVQILNMY